MFELSSIIIDNYNLPLFQEVPQFFKRPNVNGLKTMQPKLSDSWPLLCSRQFYLEEDNHPKLGQLRHREEAAENS